jgi:hypothetical protein
LTCSVRYFAADAAPAKPAAKGGKPAAGGKKKEVVKVTVKQPDSGRKYGYGSKHRADSADRRQAEVQARIKAEAAAAKAAGKVPAGIETDDEELQVLYSLLQQGKIDKGDRKLKENKAAIEEATGVARANQWPLAHRETLASRRRLVDSHQYERLINKNVPEQLKGHLAVMSDDFDAPAQTDHDLSDPEEEDLLRHAGDEMLALTNKRGYAASSPIVMNARNRLSGLTKAEVAASEAAAVQQRLLARQSVDAADLILRGYTGGGDVEETRKKLERRVREMFSDGSSSSSDSDHGGAADAATTSKRAAAAAGAGASSSSASAIGDRLESARQSNQKITESLTRLLNQDEGQEEGGEGGRGAGGEGEEGEEQAVEALGLAADYDGDARRNPIAALVNNRPTSFNLLDDVEGAKLLGAGKVFPSKELLNTDLNVDAISSDDEMMIALAEGDDARGAAGRGGDDDEDDDDESGDSEDEDDDRAAAAARRRRQQAAAGAAGKGGGEEDDGDGVDVAAIERPPLPRPRASILRAPISRAIEQAGLLPWKQLRGCVDLNDENDAMLTEQAKMLLAAEVGSKLSEAEEEEEMLMEARFKANRGRDASGGDKTDKEEEENGPVALMRKEWLDNRGAALKATKEELRNNLRAAVEEAKRRKAGASQDKVSLSGDDDSDGGGEPLDMRYIVDRGQQYRDMAARRGILRLEDSDDDEAQALLRLGVDEEEGTRIAPAFGDDLHNVPDSIIEELATPYEFIATTEGQQYPDAVTVRGE